MKRTMGASVALAVVLLGSVARAHKPGLSTGAYRLHGATLDVELTFERGEIVELVPDADKNGDRALDDAELRASGDALGDALVGRIVVRGDTAPCAGKLVSATTVEADGVVVRARFDCPARPRRVGLVAAFLDKLPSGHRHLATLEGGGTLTDAVLHAKSAGISHDVGAGADGPASAATPATADTSFFEMLKLGVEHILTGYDHLVFLLGLVLMGGRWRALVWVVTAFTLAHSITLAIAALGVWSPSPSIVEPLIAASIVYVGVENFFVKDADKRWRITFPFGLIHGFGFAGALAEVRLSPGRVPVALLAFNLGVEAGQLAVLAPVLPLVLWLRKKRAFEVWGVRAISAAIVVAGFVWFVLRVRGG